MIIIIYSVINSELVSDPNYILDLFHQLAPSFKAGLFWFVACTTTNGVPLRVPLRPDLELCCSAGTSEPELIRLLNDNDGHSYWTLDMNHERAP